MDLTLHTDKLYHIQLLEGQARVLLCDTTGLCEKARKTHSLSRTATAALGRLMTATTIIGCTLKNDADSVTCTIKGSGPIGTMMAVARSNGTVKGYVENPAVELPRKTEKLPVGDAVGRNGRLTVIKDIGLRDPYVGQVNLVSGEIAEDFAMYFTASEQTPSLVSLGVLTNDSVIAAGGLIVQMLPGASEAAIQSVENSASMFMNISGTIKEFGLDGAVTQLLTHLQPVILGEQKLDYRCDCSRERIERALVSLGKAELTDMIETQHGAEVTCHFCNHAWRFTEEELRELLQYATKK